MSNDSSQEINRVLAKLDEMERYVRRINDLLEGLDSRAARLEYEMNGLRSAIDRIKK